MSHTLPPAPSSPEFTGQTAANLAILRYDLAKGEYPIRWANDLVREIGDAQLTLSDPTNSIYRLKERLASHAYAENIKLLPADQTGGSSYGREKDLEINPASFKFGSRVIEQCLRETRVAVKHPDDLGVLGCITTLGHEAAHALTLGYSKVKHPEEAPSLYFAAGEYLSDHPESGVTGNFKTDIAIREEQFARGYEIQVLRGAFLALGYEPGDVDGVLRRYHDISPEIGGLGKKQNQLDHLRKVTAEKGPAAFVKSGPDTDIGALGYRLPLTLDELNKQIAYMADNIDSQPKAMPTENEWRVLVSQHQEPKLTERINMLHRERQNYLRTEKRRTLLAVGKTAVATLVTTGALFAGALHIANDNPKPDKPAVVETTPTPTVKFGESNLKVVPSSKATR